MVARNYLCQSSSAVDRVTISPWTEWSKVAPIWSDLVDASRDCSFFLTCMWVETWLQVYGPLLKPDILVFQADLVPVAATLLVKSRVSRSLIPVSCLSLNTSGEPSPHTAYSEYNDVLCREGFEEKVAAELANHMLRQAPYDIVLDKFADSAAYRSLKAALSTREIEEHIENSYLVNLSKVRETGGSYIEALGKKVRKHLRQNIREYCGSGSLMIDKADDIATACSMLDELASLSQQRLASLGRRSSFSSSLFRTFSHNLVRRSLSRSSGADGNVHVLRVSAEGRTVGIVVTLIHRCRVYFYQCGYNYTGDNRLSPGTVTLSQVIQYYLDAGYHEFDMLSGENWYKQILSNDHRQMFKAVFRRPGLKSTAIRCLKRISDKARRRTFPTRSRVNVPGTNDHSPISQ